MQESDQYYTIRQVKTDLQRMIDFCSTQLSRSLGNEENVYFKSRRFALIEVQRMIKYLRDPEEIPGKEQH